MSNANPTPLQPGMSGTLGGRRYTIAGRMVLGVEIGGEAYCWNEFNLVNELGASATLVYEEDGTGPQWRLFTMFDSGRPLTVAEAASKRLGDTVNVGGYPALVTLVDQSRVVHIEGRPPERVEIGDVANYFNLEAGNQLWVVSWAGDEVEYFRGMNLPAEQVAKAFGLAHLGSVLPKFSLSGGAAQASSPSFGWITKLGVALVVVVLGATVYYWLKSPPSLSLPARHPTPVSPLAVGSAGKFAGRFCRITGHAVREIRKVNAIYDWHEYHLVGDDRAGSVLVLGLAPGGPVWHRLTPARPDAPMTPHQAATKRLGEFISINGTPMRVVDLFQSEVRLREGALLPGSVTNGVCFHFQAGSGKEVVLAQWTETAIEFFKGTEVPDSEVKAAFAAKPSTPR